MLMYMHTDKAVAKGHPADRVFLVAPYKVDTTGGGSQSCHLAWKTTATPEGLSHPAFKKPLAYTAKEIVKGEKSKAKNGSTPTAWFKPDSLYKVVTLEDVKAKAIALSKT